MSVVSADQRKTEGNVCLTIHRNRRAPQRFLRRNLTHILDAHEQEVHHLQGSSDAASHEIMSTMKRKRPTIWEYPTREMLEDLTNGVKPLLQLGALQIRHPRAKTNLKKPSREPVAGDEPDWLPGTRTRSRWRCSVRIAILDTRTSKQRVHVDTRSATISQSQIDDRYSHFDVKLDKPFLIELEQLFVCTESGTNGFRWKRTINIAYTLEITIQCQDPGDSSEFLGVLEGREISSYQRDVASECVLKAVWEDLPRCPPEGQLLALKRPKGHKSLELNYKLEVTLGWSRRRSVLEEYNRLKQQEEESSQQLPTPTASDDLNEIERRQTVTWNYRHGNTTRLLTRIGLSCPLCEDEHKHSSFERLHLHVLTYHDHFKFEADSSNEVEDSDVAPRNVYLSLAPQPAVDKPVSDGKDEVHMNWVAPDRPFNLRAHLRGTDSWIPRSQVKNAKRGRAVPKEKDGTPNLTPQRIKARPALEEVEELPEHQPKKHRVPNVPGVHFYRATSKQLIQAGEYLADSDDEVDESWLDDRQSRALRELQINGAAKDFTKVFNAHLAQEQSHAGVLMREALVRFTRNYAAELQDVEFQKHFRAKLNQLQKIGLINEETVTHCITHIRAASEDKKSISPDLPNGLSNGVNGMHTASSDSASAGAGANINERPSKEKRHKWVNGKLITYDSTMNSSRSSSLTRDASEVLTNGHAPLANGRVSATPSDVPNKTARTRVCLCGVSATGVRASIGCVERECIRRDYHLACVHLDRRIANWRCAECAA